MPHPLCLFPTSVPRLQGSAALSLALLLTAPTFSAAQNASAWDKDQRSSLRLIGGSIGSGMPVLRAGIEMRIDPGWKTYWRYAGDSGLPPTFDFSGSDNVKSVTVLWPAPKRFPDGAGGNSIGYNGTVIFPLQITVKDIGTPATLRLKADYGVCENLCIPAAGKAELTLSAGPSAEDSALASAEARVPKKAALGAPGPLAILGVRRDTSHNPQRIYVYVNAPGRDSDAELFAEGPTPQWSLPIPELIEYRTTGDRVFDIAVDGVPPGATIAGAAIKLTLVAGSDAIEVTAPLD